MDKLLEQFIKRVNKPFIDLLYIVFGIIFLFAINWVYAFDISQIPNSNNINGIILTILFITVSYYVGRMLRLVSIIWTSLFWIVVGNGRSEKIKKAIKEVRYYIDGTSLSIKSSPLDVCEAEISKIVDENESIKGLIDREIMNNIFLNLNIGLVATLLFINFHYVEGIILLLLTFFEMRTHIRINKIKVDLLRDHYK